jgi:DNA-binding HxlR family transcriptional regulator
MSMTAFDEPTPHRSISPRTRWVPEMIVLSHLLDQHPRRITIHELTREVADLEGTALSRAVDNLAAASFVHREGATLIPAPAVVNFDQGPTPTNF